MEYRSKLQDPQVDMLFDSILCLENREECYRFFEDLCTINEIKSLAQRLEVAVMLREKRTYHEIAEKTGASTATISGSTVHWFTARMDTTGYWRNC